MLALRERGTRRYRGIRQDQLFREWQRIPTERQAMARVIVAMSGGVDSSVSAGLLRQQGHEVIGVFMRHGIEAEPACHLGGASAGLPQRRQGCCSAADAADARRVADALGIPFYVLNFQDQFEQIIEYFVAEYRAGRTPNPCVVCNTWLKFGKLFEYADSVGATWVATGHYARLVAEPGDEPALLRANDVAKDQSYVLFGIERRLLGRLRFPVGEYRKEEIRALARRMGLPVAAKRDSQEICFVPDRDHARLVRQRAGPGAEGEIVTTAGKRVGYHTGLENFTVGQRKGLGVALGTRQYVVRIEPEIRRVVVGSWEELACRELTAAGVNWLVEPPTQTFRAEVKIRYRSAAFPAWVEPLEDARFRVCFDQPCYGVAPGQAAVLYDGPRVLGGGWIQ